MKKNGSVWARRKGEECQPSVTMHDLGGGEGVQHGQDRALFLWTVPYSILTKLSCTHIIAVYISVKYIFCQK